MMKNTVISMAVAAIVSVVCNKILAAYTFKVIDSYVKDLIEMAKELVRDAHFDK